MVLTKPDIAHAVWTTQFSNCFNVASLTILVYDCLLTLDLEIDFIWRAKWNLVKVLFLLTRYLPFIDVGVVMYHQFQTGLTALQCAIAYQYSAWMFMVGMSIAELLLTLRTWAVWEKDKRLTIGLPLFFLSFWVAEYLFLAFFLKSLQHVGSPLSPWINCLTLNVNQLLSVCWILLMVYDAGILALIVIQSLRTFRHWGYVPLTRVIYHDGIIYFVYLFGLSLLNVIIILKLPHEFINLLSLLERIVHSLLTCRIIIHIRQQNVKTKPRDTDEIELMSLTAA